MKNLIFTLILVLCLTSFSNATTYFGFTSATAGDSSGLYPHQPKTIGGLLSTVVAGDEIRLLEATYTLSANLDFSVDGTLAAPIKWYAVGIVTVLGDSVHRTISFSGDYNEFNGIHWRSHTNNTSGGFLIFSGDGVFFNRGTMVSFGGGSTNYLCLLDPPTDALVTFNAVFMYSVENLFKSAGGPSIEVLLNSCTVYADLFTLYSTEHISAVESVVQCGTDMSQVGSSVGGTWNGCMLYSVSWSVAYATWAATGTGNRNLYPQFIYDITNPISYIDSAGTSPAKSAALNGLSLGALEINYSIKASE